MAARGCGREGGSRAERVFRAVKLLLYDITMVDAGHYLSKPTERTTPRVNPNVNYGLWVAMMCQCRFTDCNKCTTVMQNVHSGGGWLGEGAGSMRNLCTFHPILL